jgi:hypothetical protein
MLTRRHLWPAYFVALMLIVIPLFDATMSVFPPRFGTAQWRFGALGLLSNASMIPLVGLLIAFVTAGYLDQHRVLKTIGALSLVFAVLTLAALGLFALDAVQARVGIRPELARGYKIASVTAGAKMILASLTFGAFALAGLRGAKGAAHRPAGKPASSLMMTGAATRLPTEPPVVVTPSQSEG